MILYLNGRLISRPAHPIVAYQKSIILRWRESGKGAHGFQSFSYRKPKINFKIKILKKLYGKVWKLGSGFPLSRQFPASMILKIILY
jgi:hypothetical protein